MTFDTEASARRPRHVRMLMARSPRRALRSRHLRRTTRNRRGQDHRALRRRRSGGRLRALPRAARCRKRSGQPFVVDDRPGARLHRRHRCGGQERAGRLHACLLMSNTHTVNESLMPNKPFVLTRDFVPVAPINYSDLVMVVHPSVPAKTLCRNSSRSPRRNPASSTTPLRARARRITWPANSSRRWPASTSCTCRIAAARAREPTFSEVRCR